MKNIYKRDNLQPNAVEYKIRKIKHIEEPLPFSIYCTNCGGFKTRCSCKVK